uniref:Uncharacterized protein n=1 Tax=Anopheles melas TaxID=34690 RepID=A0A182UJY5_9DIPT
MGTELLPSVTRHDCAAGPNQNTRTPPDECGPLGFHRLAASCLAAARLTFPLAVIGSWSTKMTPPRSHLWAGRARPSGVRAQCSTTCRSVGALADSYGSRTTSAVASSLYGRAGSGSPTTATYRTPGSSAIVSSSSAGAIWNPSYLKISRLRSTR